METQALTIVRLVAEHGSFSAVARMLDVEPSTVSRAVSAVEGALGVRLFQRSTRTVALTEAGERWLRRAAPALEELDAAREDAAGLDASPTGTLRLTASVAFGHEVILPLLPAFTTSFPALELDLLLSDGNLDLVAERIDLAIRLAPAPRGDLVSTRLMTTRYRIVASPDYVARAGAIATPGEISQRDCLLINLPDYRSRWIFRRGGETEDVTVRGAIRISNALALRQAARAGMGPTLLADWLIGDDLRSGALLDLFPEYDVAATTFDTGAWALYPSRAFLPSKTRRTLDFLKRRL